MEETGLVREAGALVAIAFEAAARENGDPAVVGVLVVGPEAMVAPPRRPKSARDPPGRLPSGLGLPG